MLMSSTGQGKVGHRPSAPNLQGLESGAVGKGALPSSPRAHKRPSSMLRDSLASQGHEPPFELRVLEVALDVVSAHLEQLATPSWTPSLRWP